jgi:hypothetical protein
MSVATVKDSDPRFPIYLEREERCVPLPRSGGINRIAHVGSLQSHYRHYFLLVHVVHTRCVLICFVHVEQ